MLKLIHPHRETEQEAAALERWDGDGAVRLLARDDARGALLLERCEPGTSLSRRRGRRARRADRAAAAALDAGGDAVPHARGRGGVVDRLTRRWERSVAVRARLLDAALDALRELAPTQGEQVLLHQDLHADNVLAADASRGS